MPRPQGLLGAIPSRHDPRTLKLRDYRPSIPPPPPPERLWHAGINDWGALGNDRYGNCVICTAGHAIHVWSANEKPPGIRISDSAAISLSNQMGALNGYQPLDRLKWWRKREMWANRLWAFAQIQPSNVDDIQFTINAFGVVDVAVNMPAAWQDSDVWDTGNSRSYREGSWGAHSVAITGYDPQYVYCVTWGHVQPITWPAFTRYCYEAWALINPLWFNSGDALSPSLFDLQQMHADLQTITQ